MRFVRTVLILFLLTGLVAGGSAHYTVRRGETLWHIARRHGVSVAAIAALNGITDPDRLLAGVALRLPGSGADGTVRAADPPRAGRERIGELLTTTARRHGWSPAFVKALAWQESGWNPAARSSMGAVGVMQVLPETGRFASRHLVHRPLDLHEPADNITAGVAFLDYLWRLTDRDPELTLAGYYQGLRSVRTNGMYADTRRYVRNVLALRERFR